MSTAPAVSFVIPAHDEESTVGEALEALRPQLAPGDRLLVVADNCSDDTAEVARRGGAEVATRDDRERRGKGHALRFGLDRGEPRTLEEVGEYFNLTRERIRQIEARAMSKLRHPSADTGARDLLAV